MIPILIPASSVKATAMLFLDGEVVYGRELSEDALEVFTDSSYRSGFERQFGRIPDSHHAGIKAALLLMQTVEERDSRHLNDYAAWQAVAEVKTEQEMADRLVRRFKPGGAHELAIIPRKIRELKERTRSGEKAKLANRISKQDPLVAVSELLLQLNRWVRGARFILYLDRSRAKTLPGLYCPDVGTGLAALAFDHIPSSHGLGVCRRCGMSFLRMKPFQPYHSLRCGNADRKARERARKRGRSR